MISSRSTHLIVTTYRRFAPGLGLVILCGIGALALDGVEQSLFGQPIIEALVLAILIGMLLRNVVSLPTSMGPGAHLAAKQILEVGVFLLGATIDARQVLAAGPTLLVAITAGVVGGIAVSYSLGRVLGLHHTLALLVAVGNSICGNSAIAALAPAIRADKKDVASSVALTAIIGVALVLSLPVLVSVAHLSHYQYGVLAVMTVYAVPQVVAASFPVSQLSGQVATLVKLVRVLFIGPVVLVFGLIDRRTSASDTAVRRPALVPWFVVGFLVLGTLRFIGLMPDGAAASAKDISRVVMILAMAGLGLGVEIAVFRRVGPRVALAVIGSLTFLVVLSLGLIHLLAING